MLTGDIHRVIVQPVRQVSTQVDISKSKPKVKRKTKPKGKGIIYTDPEPIEHKGFFRPGFLSAVIIGKSGSGKTRLLTEILPLISDRIKTIIIATVIRGNPMHQAIVDFFNKKRGYISGIIHTPEELHQFINECEKLNHVSLEGNQGLIVFDDFSYKYGDNYTQFMIHAYTRLRNAGWHFITMCQYPTMLPPVIRNNSTFRIFFDNYSKSALDCFQKDIVGRVASIDALSTLIHYIQSVPYTYLLQQENPFTISAGKLLDVKKILTSTDLDEPSLDQIEKELGVKSKDELKKRTAYLQRQAGNTSTLLDYSSDSDSSDSY
jgi:energy-coupling factor transporter ATP-binding protein EcfA2